MKSRDFISYMAEHLSVKSWMLFFEEEPELFEKIIKGFSNTKKGIKLALSQKAVQATIAEYIEKEDSIKNLIYLFLEERKDLLILRHIIREEFVFEYIDLFEKALGEPLVKILWNKELSREFNELFPIEAVSTEKDDLKIASQHLFNILSSDTLPVSSPEKMEHHASFNKKNKLERLISRLKKVIREKEKEKKEIKKRLKILGEENAKLTEKINEKNRYIEKIIATERKRIINDIFGRYKSTLPKNKEIPKDDLFENVEKALKLQIEADREFGKIPELRMRLNKINEYLSEISRIYRESIVIHDEVKRAKDLLEREKERLLSIPGIRNTVETGYNDKAWLIRVVDSLTPTPESLHKLEKIEELLSFVGPEDILDRNELKRAIEKKRHQIFDAAYFSFYKDKLGDLPVTLIESPEDIIYGESSILYNLFIDAYNLLFINLPFLKSDREKLKRARNILINRVKKVSSHFKKIVLIFDGQDYSYKKSANMEVFFSEGKMGQDADQLILRLLQEARKEQNLLVTDDKELIQSSSLYLYGVLEPYRFFYALLGLDMVCEL